MRVKPLGLATRVKSASRGWPFLGSHMIYVAWNDLKI